MPLANRFQHQTYSAQAPTSPHHLLRVRPQPALSSDLFRRRMMRAGDQFRASGVAAIYLAHGTFVGSDALGILEDLARVYPAARPALNRLCKQLVDALAREAGNYTGQYAQRFEKAINAPGKRRIPVRRFLWSSQNNHIGRADGAVRLIDELAAREFKPTERVLLWGHSHAGNVFALVTNLLASDAETVERFFDTARVYYRWPLLGSVDIPVWRSTRLRLARDPKPLGDVALDMVTFGTPIRYGWDSAGYSKLLHFVFHRPHDKLSEYRAPLPRNVDDVLSAAGGDYVQQLGIAGTNLSPSILSWRTWWADRRLHRLLQPGMRRRDLLERIKCGTRVPNEGTTLLVDYGAVGGLANHIAGHAVYTRSQWMLFHAEQVARRFYGLADGEMDDEVPNAARKGSAWTRQAI